MLPSVPVIALTVLAAAGHGVLVWLGISLLFAPDAGNASPVLRTLQLSALFVGIALTAFGLVAALLQLGHPRHAMRAMRGWRTSWPARVPVVSLLAMLPALALLNALLHAPPDARGGTPTMAIGGVLALFALATVAAHAMVHASVRPVAAWRHPLVVPVALLCALAGGLAVTLVLTALRMRSPDEVPAMLATLSMTAMLVLAAKLLYWRDIDRSRRTALQRLAPVSRTAASDFARRHARALRLGCILLFAVPMAAWAGVQAGLGLPGPVWLLLAAAGILLGTLLERWLFIAEAGQAGHTA